MLINLLNSKVSILPSFHRLTAGYVLDKSIIDTIDQADRVIFERDLDQALRSPSLTSLQFSATPPSKLPPNLQKVWTGPAVGLVMADLLKYTIADIAAHIDSAIDRSTFLIFNKDGVDEQLWRRVDPTKRGWLQGSAELIQAMTLYPDDEQLADLAYSCDVTQRAKDFRDELSAWQGKDPGRLGSLMDQIYQRTPVRAQEMLLKRNQVMLQAVLRSAADPEQATVFVIGAAHVVGAQGLLHDLNARGQKYQIL
ncbi:TraB/GumN family protein [Roseateles sp. LYH14W]|uniref:TraB/GumN family protein n=1 Tax=Pelomonas parva TaxID=3299032 RepID=A0ABW7F802_9BURK